MSAGAHDDCFHCGQPVPAGVRYAVAIEGEERAMCCIGCQAVARAIVDGGLGDYYRHRTESALTAREIVPEVLQRLTLYDRPELQESFVRDAGEHEREAALILEGITCAACVWLNERHVGALPGVLEFRINYSTRRASVRWDARTIQLSDILRAIGAIGYIAHPYDAARQEALQRKERGAALRRLAVAGLGTMQAMMFAVALYGGAYYGIEPGMEQFLRWASFVAATPVVLYAGLPFFSNAWRDLRRRRAGMDVPVALAIGSTYLASTWATATHGGEIYFESASMFVFFLLVGRFLELGARQRANQAVEGLAKLMPVMAWRVSDAGEELVAAADLRPGDRVRVRPGEAVPADGRVLEGVSTVDESLLTGESLPRARAQGDEVVAGTMNVESPLLMRVEKVGQDTMLSAIQRLLDRAQTEKPPSARLAEWGTGWFVLAVLALTAVVGLVWWQIAPAQAFWVMIAMLVASCPCALALATPMAVTAATGSLAGAGVLTTRGHALEALAGATHIVFDKTGTLTEGRLQLEEVVVLREGLTRAAVLDLAAALEQGSEHPVARVLAARGARPAVAQDLVSTPGQGMEGRVEGRRLRIGSSAFVAALAGGAPTPAVARPGSSVVALGDEAGPIAQVVLSDQLRAGARETVAALQARGLAVLLLSGDAEEAVRHLAQSLGIREYAGGLRPEGKLAHLQALQAQGAIVAMVGDGVNDAPVLAAAHVSLAMASGTQIAQASADMILFSERLPPLVEAVDKARATVRNIRQNVGWALGYNGIALPIAALGFLTPWLAALGMSASSLIVVLNALRLRGKRAEPAAAPGAVRAAPSAAAPGP
jgi:P-type Cu2+ transporter